VPYTNAQDASVSGSTTVTKNNNNKTIDLDGKANRSLTRVKVTVNAGLMSPFEDETGQVSVADGIQNWVINPNDTKTVTFQGHLYKPNKKNYAPEFKGEFQKGKSGNKTNTEWFVKGKFEVSPDHKFLSWNMENDSAAKIEIKDNFDSFKVTRGTINCPIGKPEDKKDMTHVYNAADAYMTYTITVTNNRSPSFTLSDNQISCEVDDACSAAVHGYWSPLDITIEFKVEKFVVPNKWKQINDSNTTEAAKIVFPQIVTELERHENGHVDILKEIAALTSNFKKKIFAEGCSGTNRTQSKTYVEKQTASILDSFVNHVEASLREEDNKRQKKYDTDNSNWINTFPPPSPFSTFIYTFLHKDHK
jgi:hypothetical protein